MSTMSMTTHVEIEPKILYFGSSVVLISTMNERGYRFEADKFGVSKLPPLPSREVMAPRVQQCHIHLEVRIGKIHVKWNPMIMNFCEYFGLSEQLSNSRQAPVFGPGA